MTTATMSDQNANADRDPLESRIVKIERRGKWLLGLSILQSVLLMLLVGWQLVDWLVPSTLTWILIVGVAALMTYVFRHQVRAWLGSLVRFLFAQMFASQESDSIKDASK